MIIFPACDLFLGKCVRLYKGDYNEMTVYSDDPPKQASLFASLGATHLHIVDLEGAKDGAPANFETIANMKKASGLFCEVGGGIRTVETIRRYISCGIDRVILGTAAVSGGLLEEAVNEFGDKVAASCDIKDGFVSVKGWTESSGLTVDAFLERISGLGVRTVIVTDVSKDGTLKGPNFELYSRLSKNYGLDLIASGGVSSAEDIVRLKNAGIYGAIIGKAYYEGKVNLKDCLEKAK